MKRAKEDDDGDDTTTTPSREGQPTTTLECLPHDIWIYLVNKEYLSQEGEHLILCLVSHYFYQLVATWREQHILYIKDKHYIQQTFYTKCASYESIPLTKWCFDTWSYLKSHPVDFSIVFSAIAEGNMEYVQYLDQQRPTWRRIVHSCGGLELAFESGNIQLVDWLWEILSSQILVPSTTKNSAREVPFSPAHAICNAIKFGHVHLIHWADNKGSPFVEALYEYDGPSTRRGYICTLDPNVCYNAGLYNQKSIVDWVFKTLSTFKNTHKSYQSFLHGALNGEHFDLIERIFKVVLNDVKAFTNQYNYKHESTYNMLANINHPETLNLLKRYKNITESTPPLLPFMENAIIAGSLDVVKWRIKKSSFRYSPSLNKTIIVGWIVQSGHLHILKWYLIDFDTKWNLTTQNVAIILAIRKAIRWGHLPILEWIWETFDKNRFINDWWSPEHFLDKIFKHYRLDILIWLWNHDQIPNPLKWTPTSFKWFELTNRHAPDDSYSCFDEIKFHRWALEKGIIDLSQFYAKFSTHAPLATVTDWNKFSGQILQQDYPNLLTLDPNLLVPIFNITIINKDAHTMEWLIEKKLHLQLDKDYRVSIMTKLVASLMNGAPTQVVFNWLKYLKRHEFPLLPTDYNHLFQYKEKYKLYELLLDIAYSSEGGGGGSSTIDNDTTI